MLQKSLDDYYSSYELYPYTKGVDRLPKIQSLLFEAIQNTFVKRDIEIFSPAFTEIRGIPDGRPAAAVAAT